MESSIEEFYSKNVDESYYEKLAAELKKQNNELHAFNKIELLNKGGYPFSVKDNLCVKGVETTASLKMLEGYIPPFNATVIEKLMKHKFTFIGKTNMDEFGFGTFGLNSANPARNPFNKEYVAGGSSSGAAIATALMKYHVAIAESTGGSVSSPASFCGVVGFTPTYGVLSRYGLIDYGNSLDKIGIMARSSTDIRYVFDKIKGPDEKDSTSTDSKFSEKKRKKLFVIKELVDVADEKIQRGFLALLDRLEALEYSIENVSLSGIDKAVQAYYIISTAEASTNLAKYTGFKYGYKNESFAEPYNKFFTDSRTHFGLEAKRRIVLGTFVRGASVRSKYYDKAMKVRTLITKQLKQFLEKGYILTPTMPTLPPKIEHAKKMDTVKIYSMDVLTVPPNLCGFPHASFPYSYIDELPVGAQIVGNHLDDNLVLEFVQGWEKEFKYKFKHNLGAI